MNNHIFFALALFCTIVIGCNHKAPQEHNSNHLTHNSIFDRNAIDTSFIINEYVISDDYKSTIIYKLSGQNWLDTLYAKLYVINNNDTLFFDAWKTEIGEEAKVILDSAKNGNDSLKAIIHRMQNEMYYFNKPLELFEKPDSILKSLQCGDYWKEACLLDLKRRKLYEQIDTMEAIKKLGLVLKYTAYKGLHYERDPMGDDSPHYIWVPKIKKFLCYFNNG